MKVDDFAAIEVAAHILGFEDDYSDEQIENALQDQYNIGIEQFASLLEKLLPMIDVGTSQLTGKRYKGFSVQQKGFASIFLLKIET